MVSPVSAGADPPPPTIVKAVLGVVIFEEYRNYLFIWLKI
jgi:hypothetical protein